MNRANRERLKLVAQALGELRDEVVFVGGAVVDLYTTNPAASDARVTRDVDCIIELSNRTKYYQLEESLRRKGFVNDQSRGAPLCRWTVRGAIVDVMPIDAEIIGFTNEWYKPGFPHVFPVFLDKEVKVRILEAPYFLATKFAALRNRGKSDLRTSEDFDDIVYVLRNREATIAEIDTSDPPVKAYLSQSIGETLSDPFISEAISAVLDAADPPGTLERVFAIMSQISLIMPR